MATLTKNYNKGRRRRLTGSAGDFKNQIGKLNFDVGKISQGHCPIAEIPFLAKFSSAAIRGRISNGPQIPGT